MWSPWDPSQTDGSADEEPEDHKCILEAQGGEKKDHFDTLLDISPLKNEELEPKYQRV